MQKMNSCKNPRAIDRAGDLVRALVVIASLVGLSACGVKGDPLPPEKPVEIGRGRPTYKKATEGIRIDKAKHEPDRDADKDEDEETE
jgi:hypothetical protein